MQTANTETEASDDVAVVSIDGEEIALAPGDELLGRITAQGLVVTACRKAPLLQ